MQAKPSVAKPSVPKPSVQVKPYVPAQDARQAHIDRHHSSSSSRLDLDDLLRKYERYLYLIESNPSSRTQMQAVRARMDDDGFAWHWKEITALRGRLVAEKHRQRTKSLNNAAMTAKPLYVIHVILVLTPHRYERQDDFAGWDGVEESGSMTPVSVLDPAPAAQVGPRWILLLLSILLVATCYVYHAE
jgi:hypothetical protein